MGAEFDSWLAKVLSLIQGAYVNRKVLIKLMLTVQLFVLQHEKQSVIKLKKIAYMSSKQ